MSEKQISNWPAAAEDPEWAALERTVEELGERDGPSDVAGEWPDALWRIVAGSGMTRWAIGGEACPRPRLVQRYGKLAEGSLTAAFILSQHDAATRRLAAAGDRGRARHWLAEIAAGGVFTTVGLSQLTTSRRHGAAALRARPLGGGAFELEGIIPWVTGGVRADVLVAGAVVESNQLLFALPMDRPGVVVDPPHELAALQASCTSEVRCNAVHIEPADVLAGPCADVMATPGVAGTGGLETSALAIGQARAAIRALAHETAERGLDTEPVERLDQSWWALATALLACLEAAPGSTPAAEIRRHANSLVLSATQAYLTARKGTGFLRAENAQRWARQALFFLVWSCPSVVAQAAIRDFSEYCGL